MSSSEESRIGRRAAAVVIGVALGALVVVFVCAHRGESPVSFVRTTYAATKLMEAHAGSPSLVGDPSAPVGHRHLPWHPITEEIARQIIPVPEEAQAYDPIVYFRHPPNMEVEKRLTEHPKGYWTMRTNSLSLREDCEPMSERPDLRILVAGDSHTEGVCENSETFPHVLGRALTAAHPNKRIESINAAKGSYSFYNYLGTLEKFLYLKPDVFVVAVYGGNDFEEVLTPYHFFTGTVRAPGSAEYWPLVENALAICPAWLAQDGLSVKYFQEQPSEIELAIQAAEAATLDMQDICEQHGIRLMYVYIPSRFDGEDPKCIDDATLPHLARDLYAALEVRPESVKVPGEMANTLLRFLAEHHIPVLDVREVFRRNVGPFYWHADHHINVTAHRLIGESLVPLIESAGLAGLR